jgi:hypothetical protein
LVWNEEGIEDKIGVWNIKSRKENKVNEGLCWKWDCKSKWVSQVLEI